MAKRLKRAFTIVELVIVIAVIAILAAVLIPTFTTLIDKANESNDIALVKNLNTALVSKEATDEVNTMQDALDAAYEYGYTVDKLTPSSSGDIVWDEVNNRFALINEKKEVVFEDGAKPLTNDATKIWKIVTELAGTQDYSWYVGGLSKEAIEGFTFTMGVDTGSVEADVKYVNAAEQDVTIRTAGDRHKYDILGKDAPTYNLTFEARLPFGAAAFALLLNVVSDFGRAGQRMRRECKKEEEIDKFLRRELHKIMI